MSKFIERTFVKAVGDLAVVIGVTKIIFPNRAKAYRVERQGIQAALIVATKMPG
jgi:hypothetical protein